MKLIFYDKEHWASGMKLSDSPAIMILSMDAAHIICRRGLPTTTVRRINPVGISNPSTGRQECLQQSSLAKRHRRARQDYAGAQG